MKLISAFKMLATNRDIFMERLMFYCGTDRQFIKYWFKNKMGCYPDLDNPKTFNEKLQWLKLNYRKPILTTLVDKYAVKKYVADKIGKEYIIPTLGVWNSFAEIDFDSLPNQFVLKCTHDSGGLVICKDKSMLDKEAAKVKIERSLATDFYKQGREWPYKNVPRRIIAEQYMEEVSKTDTTDLIDYKFFCFNGVPTFCQVIRDRSTKETIDFYDMEWNHQEFYGLNPVARNGLKSVARPVHLDKMIEIATKLSNGMPMSRIDLYVINDREYFGEITLFPGCGIGIFTPEEWNLKIGNLIDIQGVNGGGYRCIINADDIQIIPAVGDLRDYKFMCFNGKVKNTFVCSDRASNCLHVTFFDRQWNKMPFERHYPAATYHIPKPHNYDLMVILAEKLSFGFPFVRVDFYEVNGAVFFGELTFFPGCGAEEFNPEEWDTTLGNEIELPRVDDN